MAPPANYLAKLALQDVRTVIGAVGMAITILSSVEPLIVLGEWTVVAVKYWQYLAQLFWDTIFGVIGFTVQPLSRDIATFMIFRTILYERISNPIRLVSPTTDELTQMLSREVAEARHRKKYSWRYWIFDGFVLVCETLPLVVIVVAALFHQGFNVTSAESAIARLGVVDVVLISFSIVAANMVKERILKNRMIDKETKQSYSIKAFIVSFALVGLCLIAAMGPSIKNAIQPPR